tara:strand:- start:97 stop:225 length:129 start_codon:yes stop_codon:yes gene_type:complete
MPKAGWTSVNISNKHEKWARKRADEEHRSLANYVETLIEADR